MWSAPERGNRAKSRAMPASVWISLGALSVVLMGVLVWGLIYSLPELLLNLLVALAVVMTLLGFLLLTVQGAKRR